MLKASHVQFLPRVRGCAVCSAANKAVMDCLCLTTPNSYTEMMVLEGRAFGRWWGHKGGALMNGISALIERPRELHCVRLQCEVRSLQPAIGRKFLTRTWTCWHPDLGLLASRTVRNKFLSLISTLVLGLRILNRLREKHTKSLTSSCLQWSQEDTRARLWCETVEEEVGARVNLSVRWDVGSEKENPLSQRRSLRTTESVFSLWKWPKLERHPTFHSTCPI